MAKEIILTQRLSDIATLELNVYVYPWGFFVVKGIRRSDYESKPYESLGTRRFKYTDRYDTYKKNLERVKSYYKIQ